MEETKTLAIVAAAEVEPLQISPPIVSSYNTQIRPLLDAVDKLRHLKIMKEGIQLPTIVVVGDQSSGKSSVLESLAGINLPRGLGICTRVPLIMRLQNHPTSTPILSLEYHNKSVDTDEAHVSCAISVATEEIAGNGKGISHTPLTLIVKKNGVPDLTMVDLPGITRVPVHGQPDDIYEQIQSIIMEYITPAESIILNVLSATVDFSTCESIRMSQKVDKSGERTLAVVTKADKAPEGLLEKVTADDVRIGLGYVCVRNRIDDESYDEARAEEVTLFESNPMLSKIDKTIVGVPILAQKLTKIQAASIARCLPGIVNQINDKLNFSITELNKLPNHLASPAETMTAFMRILGMAKESLRKILVRGEYEEYPDEAEMHCTARLAELLHQFSDRLSNSSPATGSETNSEFMMEEIQVLEEAKGIALPNFVPRSAFLNIMQKKMNQISAIPEEFVSSVWDYIEKTMLTVLGQHSENYPQMQLSLRRVAQSLVSRMKEQSMKRVKELVEMEKLSDYTCNPDYMTVWNQLMAKQHKFIEAIDTQSVALTNIDGIGLVNIEHLRNYRDVLQNAFDMKMRVIAYWKIVLRRFVDFMALHLLLSVHNLVDKELEAEVIGEMMGGGGSGRVDRLMEESPAVAGKREKLCRSIELLKESKDVVASIMDKIAVTA